MADTSGTEKQTPAALVALAWLLVGLPLSWGVYRSALNAMKLFQAPPTAVAAPASPPGAASH